MDYDATKSYMLTRPEAFEDFPFGPDVSVFKVRSKMFATLGERNGNAEINLKCDPEEAIVLRDIFDAVIPGYHMNKAHWNTVILNKSIPRAEIERMIDRSYGLVVKGMKKADRTSLEIKYGKDTIYR